MHFRLIWQSSVSLENHPDALHRATAELARHRINLHGLSNLENIEQGVVRLRTNNAARAKELLNGIGLTFTEAEIFEFDLPDKPGRLDEVCDALANAGVNIAYAYGTRHDSVKCMRVRLKASPIDRAKGILNELPSD